MNERMLGARLWGLALVLMIVPLAALAGTASRDVGTQRAGWLLGHAALEDRALVGFASDQVEIGGSAPEIVRSTRSDSSKKTVLHLISSLILPGSGEAMMGYKRGYLMMAADIFAWTRVAKYNKDGDDIQEQFYAYADQHWRESRLVEAYKPGSQDENRNGLGAIYHPEVGAVNDSTELTKLPLWVAKENDHWEYYENLGKWDQFVFGWDDFVNPYDPVATGGYVPTGTLADLQQPFTSVHRDIYREMRGRSDDAYAKRDHWRYVNIGLRIFSVVQTAYLEGLLGGSHSGDLEISGHKVSFRAQPRGWGRGTMAAAVSF